MKNKHLVLLFLVTVAVGWLLRRAPWQARQIFQTELIQVDTVRLNQLRIVVPGQPELLLERTENGWAAQQNDRSVMVAATAMAPLLQALSAIRSIRVVKTGQADTLGLSEKESIQITAYQAGRAPEDFRIGWEILENRVPATFLRLGGHKGIYLVEQHLRGIFAHTLEDFRLSDICRFAPADVRSLTVEWPAQSWALRLRRDSTGGWRGTNTDTLRSDSAVLAWLRPLSHLPPCTYADYFDDSRARETLRVRVMLEFEGATPPLTLRLFRIDPGDLPENLAEIHRGKTLPVPYVLHSSQNANNYFALADSALAWRISYGLDSSALLLPVISRHGR